MKSLLQDKKNEDISKLFDEISHQYDFLNHFLSFGVDKFWRKKLIRMIRSEGVLSVLDVATGTADLAIYSSQYIDDAKITGIDISEKMLEIGRNKVHLKHLDNKIELLLMPAEKISFKDNTFDTSMVAFGVRNFESLSGGLKEMLRVIKPGKKFFILEFSKPKGLFSLLYLFYFKLLLPLFGRMVSKHKNAYSYLRDSVLGFPEGNDFLKIMDECGSINNTQKRLSGGIATIYIGQKQKKHLALQ
jgi:demethylmenaquinone methyltransferase / 2-methoxy-6-polyprenyl-1,4-benzoquinol methylase